MESSVIPAGRRLDGDADAAGSTIRAGDEEATASGTIPASHDSIEWSSEASGLDGGEIAAIVISLLVVVILIVIGCFVVS
jgi:hypothetical protein